MRTLQQLEFQETARCSKSCLGHSISLLVTPCEVLIDSLQDLALAVLFKAPINEAVRARILKIPCQGSWPTTSCSLSRSFASCLWPYSEARILEFTLMVWGFLLTP